MRYASRTFLTNEKCRGVPWALFVVFWLVLFFHLVVLGVEFAPAAVLFDLDLALDELFVFAGPIVNTLALLAREFDESVLRRHSCTTILISRSFVNCAMHSAIF